MPSIVALIPARAGSKRVPGKNTRLLGGRRVIGYTSVAAVESGIFQRIYVCTDDPDLLCASPAIQILERAPIADDQPDIEWVKEALCQIGPFDAFAILRPTSPFRTSEAIALAWQDFLDNQPCDSLRAVQAVHEHPLKMWERRGAYMIPAIEQFRNGTPCHSLPTHTLPEYYVQNASLEIAWTRTVQETGTISGRRILPFVYPTLDINTEADWREAERLMSTVHA